MPVYPGHFLCVIRWLAAGIHNVLIDIRRPANELVLRRDGVQRLPVFVKKIGLRWRPLAKLQQELRHVVGGVYRSRAGCEVYRATEADATRLIDGSERLCTDSWLRSRWI